MWCVNEISDYAIRARISRGTRSPVGLDRVRDFSSSSRLLAITVMELRVIREAAERESGVTVPGWDVSISSVEDVFLIVDLNADGDM